MHTGRTDTISIFCKSSKIQPSRETDPCGAGAGQARFVNAWECGDLAGAIFKAYNSDMEIKREADPNH